MDAARKTVEQLRGVGEKELEGLLLRMLAAKFRFREFRSEEQRVACMRLLQGVDTLVLMPTGAGKSLTYQLPALVANEYCGATVVVLSPLKALIEDQARGMREKGMSVSLICSGIPEGDRATLLASLHTPSSTPLPSVILTTPESLSLESVFSAVASAVGQGRVLGLVVDEAHCIVSWGEGFRPSYSRIGTLRARLSRVGGERPLLPLLAATATASPRTVKAVCTSLHLTPEAVVRARCDRPNLRYGIIYADSMSDEQQDRALVRELRLAVPDLFPENDAGSDEDTTSTTVVEARTLTNAFVSAASYQPSQSQGEKRPAKRPRASAVRTREIQQQVKQLFASNKSSSVGAAVVYCSTRNDTESLCARLRGLSEEATGNELTAMCIHAYHAGMTDAQRRDAMALWNDQPQSVMVATIGFGLGIDRPDVRSVVRWSLPASMDALAQEAGRGGRDGKPARWTAFFRSDDASRVRHLVMREGQTSAEKLMVSVDSGTFGGGKATLSSPAVQAERKRIEDLQESKLEDLTAVVSSMTCIECRRFHLLRHFGDRGVTCAMSAGAKLCDVCEDASRVRKALEASRGGRKGHRTRREDGEVKTASSESAVRADKDDDDDDDDDDNPSKRMRFQPEAALGRSRTERLARLERSEAAMERAGDADIHHAKLHGDESDVRIAEYRKRQAVRKAEQAAKRGFRVPRTTSAPLATTTPTTIPDVVSMTGAPSHAASVVVDPLFLALQEALRTNHQSLTTAPSDQDTLEKGIKCAAQGILDASRRLADRGVQPLKDIVQKRVDLIRSQTTAKRLIPIDASGIVRSSPSS
jgi:superfamily II DNA helicase RecQ